jgi:hypothetical protein
MCSVCVFSNCGELAQKSALFAVETFFMEVEGIFKHEFNMFIFEGCILLRLSLLTFYGSVSHN